MGFLSKTCRRCERSILSNYATTHACAWASQAVFIPGPDTAPVPALGVVPGEPLELDYDGYGIHDDGQLTSLDWQAWQALDAYHALCWHAAGRPEYIGPAQDAPDQGFFIDPADFTTPPAGGAS